MFKKARRKLFGSVGSLFGGRSKKKSGKKSSGGKRKSPRRLKAGEKVIMRGLPPRPEGMVTYQLGDQLIAKKMRKGAKKGHNVKPHSCR